MTKVISNKNDGSKWSRNPASLPKKEPSRANTSNAKSDIKIMNIIVNVLGTHIKLNFLDELPILSTP